MSPMEAKLIQELIQNKYGARAKAGNAMDFAGTALGFVDDAVSPAAGKLQNAVVGAVGKLDPKYPAQVGSVLTNKGKVLSMLSGPQAGMLAKGAVGLGAVGGVLGAADIIAGQDSAANKIMDTAAMGIGGFLGAAGGPMGIAAGAGLGKAASDATQFLLGGGKSAEQRKIEEALAALRGGQI
jgi:hypothetical protein